MIDRIAPTRRPSGKASGYQRWRSLLFMHWVVPVDAVRRLVPPALELDLFAGSAYVGVVPFRMEGVRPRWWTDAASFGFLETNVRTYVHYRGQPGVYFFSLDAASRLAVCAARTGWGLPYYFAAMTSNCKNDEFTYSSRRARTGERLSVRFKIGEPLPPSIEGTIEYFLIERYLLFVERRKGIFVGQVHHRPYSLQSAEVLDCQDELTAAAGLLRAQDQPCYAHYATGVDVEVFRLRWCR